MITYSNQKLDLPTIDNVRQLGGYIMKDGRKIKNNMLIRSGDLNKLSEEDEEKLKNEYNLKEIIDFRTDTSAEQGGHPDIMVENVHYHFCPAMDSLKVYDKETFKALNKCLESSQGNIEIDSMIVLAEHNGMKQLYDNLLKSEQARHAYRKLFDVLIKNAESENPGAVLWHCTQGKDRAGVASALILTALGADESTILRDYSLTTDFYLDKIMKTLEFAKNTNMPEEVLHEFLGIVGKAYPENLQRAIDSIGSFENYLTNELGLTEEELKILKNSYLE